MVGGYQIIDLDKYNGKTITSDEYFNLIAPSKGKPFMYKATVDGVTYRTQNYMILYVDDNVELHLHTGYSVSATTAAISVNNSWCCVIFTKNADTYTVSIEIQ